MIIVFGITALVALLISIVFTVLIGFTSWRLLAAVRGTVRDGVSPLLQNALETARGVQGTTLFISDTLVAPLIKVYGVYAGLRRGVSILTRAGRKRR